MEKNIKTVFEFQNRKTESGNPFTAVLKRHTPKEVAQKSNTLEFFEAETFE
jgi:hypothetical protein